MIGVRMNVMGDRDRIRLAQLDIRRTAEADLDLRRISREVCTGVVPVGLGEEGHSHRPHRPYIGCNQIPRPHPKARRRGSL